MSDDDTEKRRSNRLTEWMIKIGLAKHEERVALLEKAGAAPFDGSANVAARAFLAASWSGLAALRGTLDEFMREPKKASAFKKRYAESKDFRRVVSGSMFLASYELAHRATPSVSPTGDGSNWANLLAGTVGDTAEHDPFLARALVTAGFIAQAITMIKDGALTWSDCLGTVTRARESVEQDTEDRGPLTKELLFAGIEDARRWLSRARTEAMAVDLSGKHTPMETEGPSDV